MSGKYRFLNFLFITGIAIVCIVTLGSCATTTPTPTPPAQPNMPNPASVFCEQNGGKVDIRTAADGSQSGACVFADGSECDEWAFYRGECGADKVTPSAQPGNMGMANPASVFCEQNGGKVDIRTAADGSQSGACVFADGSECDEWAFYRGECGADKVTPKP